MIIEMSYAEMSFLSELVKAKQLAIWRELFLPEFEDSTSKDIDTAFEQLMSPVYEFPLTDRACCAKLLDKFAKAEEIVHKVFNA